MLQRGNKLRQPPTVRDDAPDRRLLLEPCELHPESVTRSRARMIAAGVCQCQPLVFGRYCNPTVFSKVADTSHLNRSEDPAVKRLACHKEKSLGRWCNGRETSAAPGPVGIASGEALYNKRRADVSKCCVYGIPRATDMLMYRCICR